MPVIADSDVLIVVLYLVIIFFLYALNEDAGRGSMFGVFLAIIGLSFGFYIQTLLGVIYLSAAIVATFLVLLVRTIGEIIDTKTEG